MKIIINNTYSIEVDTFNYTVYRHGLNKKGSPTKLALGYYRNILTALTGIHKDMVASHDIEITKVSEYIDTLKNDMKKVEDDIERVAIILENKIKKEKE